MCYSRRSDIVQFGKYKGKPIGDCLWDVLYWNWVFSNLEIEIVDELFLFFCEISRKHWFYCIDSGHDIHTEDAFWQTLYKKQSENFLETLL